MPESAATNGGDASPVAIGIPTANKLIPSFDDPLVERQYLKGRLALGFRIFAKLGYDEG